MAFTAPSTSGSDATVLSKIQSFIDARLTTVSNWATKASNTAESSINSVGVFTRPNITLTSPTLPTIGTLPASPTNTPVPTAAISNSPKAAGFESKSDIYAPPMIEAAVAVSKAEEDRSKAKDALAEVIKNDPTNTEAITNAQDAVKAADDKVDSAKKAASAYELEPPVMPEVIQIASKLHTAKDTLKAASADLDAAKKAADPAKPETIAALAEASSKVDAAQKDVDKLAEESKKFLVQDVPNIDMPVPPKQFTQLAMPAMPKAPSVKFTDQPDVSLPTRPVFETIKVTSYTFPTISEFVETLPHYDISLDEGKLDSALSTFATEFESSINGLKSMDAAFRNKLPSLLDKGVDSEVLEKDAQQIVNKIDFDTMAAIKQTISKYGNRNFPYMSGPMVAEITEIQADSANKIMSARSEIVARMNDKILKDYTTRLDILVGLERSAQDLIVYEAQKRLDIQKIRVNAQIEMFNTTVQLFNMEQEARRSYLDAYSAELQSRLRVLETYQPLVDGAIAKLSENEANVQVFSADLSNQQTESKVYSTYVQTLIHDIKVYNETVRGLKAQADTTSVNIEAYREAVKGYAAAVEASGTNIKAFAEQARASTSMSSIVTAAMGAYSEYVQQVAKQGELWKTYYGAHSESLQANISAFQSAVQVEDSRVRALVAAIEGKTEITTAQASAVSNALPAYSAYNRANAMKSEAERAYALAVAENLAQVQALTATAQAATDKVNAGAAAAKAVAASALAQGAMSAMYVSKSVQGAISQAVSASKETSAAENFGSYDTTADTYRKSLSA